MFARLFKPEPVLYIEVLHPRKVLAFRIPKHAQRRRRR